MRTDQNKKAPDALAGDHGAIEINHLQNNPDFWNCQEPVDPVIPELIGLVKRINELYKSHGVLNVGACGERRVQVFKEGSFFDLFGFGECDEEYLPDYDRYSTTVDGVEFFCLVEKGGSN
jgi:hypothetical protein